MFLRVLAATGLIFSVFAFPALAAEDPAAPPLYNTTQQPGEKPAADAMPAAPTKAQDKAPVEEKRSAIPAVIPPPVRGMKTISSQKPAEDSIAKAKQAEIQRQSKIEYEQRAAKIKAEDAKNGTNRLETMKAAFEAAAKADEAEMVAEAAGKKAGSVQPQTTPAENKEAAPAAPPVAVPAAPQKAPADETPPKAATP